MDEVDESRLSDISHVDFGGAFEVTRDDPGITPGDQLFAMLTNDWSRLPSEVRNQQTVSTDTGGGYLVDSLLSGMWVDLARSASRVVEAGAQTIHVEGAKLAIARVTKDPTPHRRPETSPVTASSAAFDRIVLRPRTLGVIVAVSIEWLEDSSNGPSILNSVIQSAMGLAVDQAALKGSGSESEPQGIYNNEDVPGCRPSVPLRITITSAMRLAVSTPTSTTGT